MALKDQKPTISMLLLQVMYAGITLVTRVTFVNGMSPRVFVVYRQTMATLIMAPIAFLTRKSSTCKLGWKNFWMIFSLSLIGVTINQNIYFEGLYLASSSVASALGNLVPAITFVMAYVAGFEKISIRSLRSIAKIIGTIICVSGAFSMVMKKGPKLLNKEFPLMHSLFITISSNGSAGSDQKTNWLVGCLLLLGSNICWSLWLILQVPVSKSYPDHLSLTAWMCCIAAFQSGIITFFIEPDLEAWKVQSYQDLGSCFFAAWCISRRGPLFSAMFNPLSTVIVTAFACIFLHEEMYTGSLAGSVAVICGLYVVLWGKEKDEEEDGFKQPEDLNQTTQIDQEESCRIDLEQPLLISTSPHSKDHQEK